MAEATAIRVAEIFNDRELALTGGSTSGVAVDDVFRIFDPSGKEIRDPDTDEVLGEIIRTKAIVRVYEVQDRFALARTYRTRKVNVGGTGGGLAQFGRIFEAPQWETRVETLRRDPEKGTWGDAPKDSIVAVGDLAEKISDQNIDDIPSYTIWK